MVWLCKFRGSINGWDFRYFIGIWKVEKNCWKKKEWNGMEWFWGLEKLKKNEKIEWNGIGKMGWPNGRLKILYRDFESWKNNWKKNKMECDGL